MVLSGMRSLTGVSARLRAGFGPPLASPVIMKAIVIIIIFKKERFPLPLGPPIPSKCKPGAFRPGFLLTRSRRAPKSQDCRAQEILGPTRGQSMFPTAPPAAASGPQDPLQWLHSPSVRPAGRAGGLQSLRGTLPPLLVVIPGRESIVIPRWESSSPF